MLIYIMCFARTGGMILCETIGEHSQIIPLNEVVGWPGKIKPGKNYCIKLNYYEMRGSKIIEQGKDAKFISLNRNLHDIAASFKGIEKAGQNARAMLLHGGDPKDAPYLAAVKQYQEFLTWRNEFKDLPNHLVIDFEDMIIRKEETFEKIFKFLGFGFEDSVMKFIHKFISNDPIKNKPYRAFSVSPNKKIGSYKDILTKQEIWRINSIIPRLAHAS